MSSPSLWPENQKALAVSSEGLDRFGGAKRDRTVDLYNAIVALSQLSYGPEFWGAVCAAQVGEHRDFKKLAQAKKRAF